MSKDEIVSFIQDPDRMIDRSDAYLRFSREDRRDLILALKELRNEETGKFLTAVLPGEADKEIQKLIKKLLFRLRTMGIKVEEPRVVGEPALRAIDERKQHRGFLSNYDIQGTRIVIVALEVKRNYYIFINAVTHLFHGLTDLKLVPLAKQELDAVLGEYRKGAGENNVFLDISPRYAAWLIEEGDAISRRFTDDVRQLKQFASTLKDGVQNPQDIYNLEIPDDIVPLPVSTVLSDDLFQSFVLEWDTLKEDRKTLASIGGSTILVPPHMVEEKMETFFKDLLESDSLKSKTPFVRRLLEDYAYIFHLSGKLDSFKTLRELLENEKGPYGALSFFAGKVLEAKEDEPDLPGIIVNPYEQVRR